MTQHLGADAFQVVTARALTVGAEDVTDPSISLLADGPGAITYTSAFGLASADGSFASTAKAGDLVLSSAVHVPGKLTLADLFAAPALATGASAFYAKAGAPYFKSAAGAELALTPAGGTVASPPHYSRYQAAVQSIPTGAITVLKFDTLDQSQDNATAITYNTGTGAFTVTEAGVYLIQGTVQFAPGTTGERDLIIATDTTGNDRWGLQGEGSSAQGFSASHASVARYLAAGTTFYFTTFQNQGTAQDTVIGGRATRMEITKLSGLRGADGLANQGVTPPLLSRYMVAVQSIPNITATKLLFDTGDQNQNNSPAAIAYDPATGTWTVNETGLYAITGQMVYGVGPAAGYTDRYLIVAGPAVSDFDADRWGEVSEGVNNTNAARLSVTVTRWLTAGAQFAIWTYQGAGSAQSVSTFAKETRASVTKLSGVKGDQGPAGVGLPASTIDHASAFMHMGA